MFRLIEDLPQNVLGIEAIGQITHEDYQSILIPKADAMIAQGKIRMLYVAGPEFRGYELEALWDDSRFGILHWHDVDRIAVVSDHAWLRAAVAMFKPFFAGVVRLFRFAELNAAKSWISEPGSASR